MKFREIRQPAGDPENWIKRELFPTLRDWIQGLKKLTLSDNFDAAVVSFTIDPGKEKTVYHNLGVIPTGYIALRNGYAIADGDTPWTTEYITVKSMVFVTIVVKLAIVK